MVFETSLIAEISTQCLTVGPWRHCAKSWRGESKIVQYFNMFLSLKCVHYFWNFLFNIFGSQVSGDSFSGKRRALNKEGLPCIHRVCFFGSSHYGVGGPCHLPSLEAAVVYGHEDKQCTMKMDHVTPKAKSCIIKWFTPERQSPCRKGKRFPLLSKQD